MTIVHHSNQLHKHIPTFVDDRGADRTPFKFTTVEDLKALPWVKSFIERQDKRQFEKLVYEDHGAGTKPVLMAVYDQGFYWWVIGYMDHVPAGLDKWEGWKHRAMGKDRQVRVLTNEVVTSCGYILTLADGTHLVDVTDGEPENLDNLLNSLDKLEPGWNVYGHSIDWNADEAPVDMPNNKFHFPTHGSAGEGAVYWDQSVVSQTAIHGNMILDLTDPSKPKEVK